MTRFVKSHSFEAEMEASPGFERAMASEASEIARQVRAVAPKRTGYYIRHVSSLGARVTLGDFAWHLIEYGSAHNRPYAPVRKGVRAAGHRYRDARSNT